MITVIKDFGRMYKSPFQVQFDPDNVYTPYRVYVFHNGHYFATRKAAFEYAETLLDEYFKDHPRRKYLY